MGLYAVIEARKREPGASLYLLTDPVGEPLAGNVEQIPAEVLLQPGFVADQLPRQREAAIKRGRRWSESMCCRAASAP